MLRRRLPHVLTIVPVLAVLMHHSARASNSTGNATGTGLLGSEPAAISVASFTGAAGVSYQIVAPPGRLGLQPDLLLHYNSSSSEPSPLGRGWAFDLPFIERDTRFRQPRFDSTDKFVLIWEGRRLELLGGLTPGVPISTFDTRILTSLRVRAFTAGAVTHWQVEDGRGRLFEFGLPGPLGGPGQTGDFHWALNRVVDSHGNYMTYDWFQDSGVLYLSEIGYTGHPTIPEPSNRVDFTYEERLDVDVSRSGVKPATASREWRYRLRRARTWAGGNVVSVYLFDYTTPGTGTYSTDLCADAECGQSQRYCSGNGSTVYCNNSCTQDTGFCVACSPSCCATGACGTTVTTCPGGWLSECLNPCNPAVGCGSCTPICGGGGGGGGGCGAGAEFFDPEPVAMGTPQPCFSEAPSPGGLEPESIGTEWDGSAGESLLLVVDNGKPSLLSRIVRYDGAGTANMPPTSFTYQDETPAQKAFGVAVNNIPASFLRKETTATARDTYDHGIQIVDINRDGLPDIVQGHGSTCPGAVRCAMSG